MNRLYFLIPIAFSLISCSGLDDAGKVLRNEKTYSNDEFLVKKREPLVLPPDYDKLPKPGQKGNQNNNEDKLKKILKSSDKTTVIRNKSSTVEKSILDKIRK